MLVFLLSGVISEGGCRSTQNNTSIGNTIRPNDPPANILNILRYLNDLLSQRGLEVLYFQDYEMFFWLGALNIQGFHLGDMSTLTPMGPTEEQRFNCVKSTLGAEDCTFDVTVGLGDLASGFHYRLALAYFGETSGRLSLTGRWNALRFIGKVSIYSDSTCKAQVDFLRIGVFGKWEVLLTPVNVKTYLLAIPINWFLNNELNVQDELLNYILYRYVLNNVIIQDNINNLICASLINT